MSFSTTKQRSPTSSTFGDSIRYPGLNDVMLGRGAGPNNHIGNIRFRQLVASFEDRYKLAAKSSKPIVAAEIVELWKRQEPAGRFVIRKQQSQGNETSWFVVDDAQARKKTSQCLRDLGLSSNHSKKAIRSSTKQYRPIDVESDLGKCTKTSAIGHFLYEGQPDLNSRTPTISSLGTPVSKEKSKQEERTTQEICKSYDSSKRMRRDEQSNYNEKKLPYFVSEHSTTMPHNTSNSAIDERRTQNMKMENVSVELSVLRHAAGMRSLQMVYGGDKRYVIGGIDEKLYARDDVFSNEVKLEQRYGAPAPERQMNDNPERKLPYRFLPPYYILQNCDTVANLSRI